jgi:hypothetical protein
MRPFFDASEFPRPAFVKDEHRYQGLRYNCTLNLQCSSATWTTEYGGASETLGNRDGDEGYKGTSDAIRPNKQEKMKLSPSRKAVVGQEAMCACA